MSSGDRPLMNINESIVRTPWDTKAFGMDTYEIKQVTKEALDCVLHTPGHFTVKVLPLSSKKLLHEYGFYYCDTLIEPFCSAERFVFFTHESISISKNAALDDLITISHGAFTFGRFHRDFNMDKQRADMRYDLWLRELFQKDMVMGLMFNGRLAGFFAVSDNRILLHALSKEYREKGLSKFFWSAACSAIFKQGHREIVSSVSASHFVVLNLYASLGFRFRKPLDVYHRLVT